MFVSVIGAGGFITCLIDEFSDRSCAAVVFDKVTAQTVEVLNERAFKQLFEKSAEIGDVIAKVPADICDRLDLGEVVVHVFCNVDHEQVLLVVGDGGVICRNDRKDVVDKGACQILIFAVRCAFKHLLKERVDLLVDFHVVELREGDVEVVLAEVVQEFIRDHQRFRLRLLLGMEPVGKEGGEKDGLSGV